MTVNLTMIMKILPYLFQLIGIAERYITAPKSGETKKAFVIDSAKLIVGSVAAESTGGQKETWDKIEQPVNDIIDTTVGVFNKFNWFMDTN